MAITVYRVPMASQGSSFVENLEVFFLHLKYRGTRCCLTAEEILDGLAEGPVTSRVDERIGEGIGKGDYRERAMERTSSIGRADVAQVETDVGDLIGRPGDDVDNDDNEHHLDDAVPCDHVEGRVGMVP